MRTLIDRILGHGRTYRLLAPQNREAIDQYNQNNLSILSLLGALMVLIPVVATPFSATKGRLIPFYVTTILIFFTLYAVNKLSVMRGRALLSLYFGFSLFFALSIYLSVIHTPHMRATILIGTFCIMPLAFIDAPWRMNLFVLFWFSVHTLLAFYFKPLYALDDTINILGFGILGSFFGNLNTALRVKSYEAHRLLTIERETDSLTGLYNRRKLFEVLEDFSPTAVMMIDIDHFKEYNEEHGHLAADLAMQSMASLLLEFGKRENLTFFRYGGEEFIALSLAGGEEEIIQKAEELRTLIEETSITVSIGVAHHTGKEMESEESLINRADKAVFQAKRQGRNQVVAYHDR